MDEPGEPPRPNRIIPEQRMSVKIIEQGSMDTLYEFEGRQFSIPDKGEIVSWGDSELFPGSERYDDTESSDFYRVVRRMWTYQRMAADFEVDDLEFNEEQMLTHVFLYVERVEGELI